MKLEVENFGDQQIANVQVTDLLSDVFMVADSWNIISVESEEFMVNTSYDGDANPLLLLGTDTLGVAASGDEGVIYLKINVCPGTNLGPYDNTAFVNGVGLDGTSLVDQSQNGTNPDTNGDGDATDNNEVTPISFMFAPSIGIAKRVADASLNPDGSFDVTYEINIENYGDVLIDSIQAVDSLLNTFPGACTIGSITLTSGEFSVNPNYGVAGDWKLLLGNDNLAVSENGFVLLTVNVSTCGSTGPFENTANVTARSSRWDDCNRCFC